MSKKMISIRFGEREIMLLRELSKLTGASISMLVRAMIMHDLDNLMDSTGNFKLNGKDKRSEKT